MPNYIKNKIIVGKTEYGRRIVDKYTTIEDGEIKFDFNKVIEMPKELQIEFSSTSDKALCLYLTKINPLISYYGTKEDKLEETQYNHLINKLESKPIMSRKFRLTLEQINNLLTNHNEEDLLSLGKRQVDNVIEYNALNWYDWSIKNWGTKWNASSFITFNNTQSLTFETAWDPAIGIIIELSKQNPDIKIAFLYSDESIGCNVGWLLIHNGVIDKQGSFEDYSVDAYKLAFDLWGCEEDYEYNNELGTYVLKDID